jgi:pyruvate dehydrogenase E2 component (dihydrolipoamide acetyltransferase)
MKVQGWRKIASATWGRPNDPQIYGDLELDATRLLAFIEEARAATGVHVTVTHIVGKIDFTALLESERS